MASTSRKVLLLGASGFFGSPLRAAFGPGVTLSTHYTNASSAGSLAFDARTSHIQDLLQHIDDRPRVAVILFGITKIDKCARAPVESHKVNVEGAIRIIDELKRLDIIPVFVSSDAVFDGTKALWREDDDVCPILTYGQQKAAVERYLSTLPPPWLIVRLPKLVAAIPDPRCMITGWIDALGRPGKILCATDQYFTPIGVEDAAMTVARLVEAGETGLYHVGGPERLSRLDLLRLVTEARQRYGTTTAEVIPCSLGDLPFLEPRPLDTSMCSDKVRARLSVAFRSMAAVVQAVVDAKLNPNEET